MNSSDEPDDTASSDGGDPAAAAVLAASLVEVNEQLVVSMMRAQAEAETAAWSLREATRLAELDALTGLPNRVLLLDRIAQALVAADRHQRKSALLFVDLDHFKSLNDTLGHAAGDAMLRRVAQCLLTVVRKADTVCRFGGDEFVVLLAEVSAAPGAGLTAAKIIAAVRDAGGVTGNGPAVTASIGISVYPDDGRDAQTLIALADAAMYRAKAFGGGYFLFHSAGALETSGRTRPPAPSDRRSAARGRATSSYDPHEAHLREVNEELLISSLRGSDERQRAEDSLRLAMEAVGMGSWELDLATERVTRSVAADLILGDTALAATEPLTAFVERFVDDDRDPVARSFEVARTSGTLEFERRVRRANDHSLRLLHFKGRTIFERGVARRIVGVVEDESDRRSVEAQLRQAQKMEAVGQLTGGIAHDLNNLLLVIGGNLELLERHLPTDDRTIRLLTSARRAVATGSKLNEQLLAFARRQDLRMAVIAIAELLPTFEDLLRSAMSATVVVDVVTSSDTWLCYSDAHQLEVAILNLAINARDAMPGGGHLTLELGNQTVSADLASTWGGVAGDHVFIGLSDTGTGMPADVKARAFEPFFTTKEIGKGTGLGLSQVYGFARQCGGFVSITDGPAGGTVVTIHLPRSTLDRTGTPREVPARGPSGKGGVVLVVEDNAEVRAVTHAMLDDLDYRVVEAGSAEAALTLLSQGTAVDIVLSDVVMPGTSGLELALAIRALYPALPVLLMSGYTAQQTLQEEVGASWQVLRKPYTQAALSTAMQNLLTSRSTAPSHPGH